jgi:hypothetical protein
MRAAISVVALTLAGLTLAGVGPASASGGLWCSAEDSSVKFIVQAGLTRGSGAHFNLRGELHVLLPTVPAGTRDLKLDGGDLIQRWLDNREAKLLFYRDRDEKPFGYFSLLVETKRGDADDEGSYSGNYVLTITYMKSEQDSEATVVEARGDASCSAE